MVSKNLKLSYKNMSLPPMILRESGREGWGGRGRETEKHEWEGDIDWLLLNTHDGAKESNQQPSGVQADALTIKHYKPGKNKFYNYI